MQSGESKKTTLANDVEGRDSVQEFIEDNLQDEQRVRPYKRYKNYSDLVDKWSWRIWVAATVAFLVVAVIQMRLYGSDSTELTTPFSYIFASAFIVPLLIGFLAFVARWYSDMTAEKVAYHELASAFQQYRQNPDKLEPVVDRVENSVKFFNPHRFDRLDSSRLDETERYIDKLVKADDSEYISNEIHETFPTFMQQLSTAVAPASESPISKIAKDMDSAYTGEPTLKERMIIDIKRLAQFLFTGTEAVVIFSLLGLAGLVYYMNIEISTGFGILGVIIGVYSLYQNRDS